jgi:dienelactone hydrolase
MKRENVEFLSEAAVIRAWLYRPEGDGPFPAIVAGHGFTGVKEGFLHHDYPGVFAKAGFMVLAFDYPCSGESGGPLRGELDPIAQQRAYRDAMTYLCDRPDVDANRIGLWGTSYGGGHVLAVGAHDRRVRCIVSQVPTISGYENALRRYTPDGFVQKRKEWAQDRLDRLNGKPPRMIKALADDNMFTRMPPECSVNLDTHVTERTMEMYAEYEPAAFIERIAPTPLLMIIADEDTMTFTDQELAAFARAREPKSLLIVRGDHRVVYFDAFERTASAARDWFVTHL